jgi:tetratricopeptide (TPR) repeat protein
MHKKISLLGTGIVMLAVLFGCATQNVGTYGTPGPQPGTGAVYQPQVPPGITTPEAAKADLNVLLNHGRKWGINLGSGRYYSEVDVTLYANIAHLTELTKGSTGLTARAYDVNKRLDYMVFKSAPVLDDRIELAPRMPFFYADLSEYTIAVTRYTGKGYDYAVPFGNRLSFLFDYLAEARRFAADLFVIQQSLGREDEERRARFEARVAEYRAMAVKPPVTEEQRKYIVQANALSQRKEYSGAIDLYRKAIEVDPVSYPGAYFNMALLSGQLRRYKSAIMYMKQYLMLIPDAKDARSAQDKIYEWEMLFQK